MYRLKELRDAKRLSQRDLAAITGIPAANIGRWENNKSSMPIDGAIEIAKALGVEVTDLVDEDPTPTRVLSEEQEQVLRDLDSMPPDLREIMVRLIAQIAEMAPMAEN